MNIFTKMENDQLARLTIVLVGVIVILLFAFAPSGSASPVGQGCGGPYEPPCDDPNDVNPDPDGDGVIAGDRCPDRGGHMDDAGCPPDDLDGDYVYDPNDECPDVSAPGTENGCYDDPIDDEAPANNDDPDEDGIFGSDDLCPDIPGTVEFSGCVYLNDADGDAVDDSIDACPGFDDNADADGDGIPDGCDDDRDGDGVTNADDACPDVPGIDNRFLRGCPELDELLQVDDDGDGVFLPDDECPSEQGLPENNGCPETPVDSDGDGVPDDIDQCDDIVGTEEAMGCLPRPVIQVSVPLDSDGDSVPDDIDRCPYTFGAAGNDGCPPDSDGDGIVNMADGCPLRAGPRSNNGCPEPTTNVYSDVVITNQRVCTANHTFSTVIRANNNRAWQSLMPSPFHPLPRYIKIEVVTTAGSFTISAPVFGPRINISKAFETISMEAEDELPDDAEIIDIIPPANFSVRENRTSITTSSRCEGSPSSLFDYAAQTGSYDDIIVEGQSPSTGGCKKNNGFQIIFGC